MSWSEDDFLERLMPALRREVGGSNSACPDAATVRAVIEGEASDWMRDAYAQHLAECSECLELDSRLRNFDRPVLVKDEAEWKQTEKRLDNWLNAHLESRAVASRRTAEQRASRPGFWESNWRPGLAWKISWALGLVALLAIGAGVYMNSREPVPPQEAMAPALATPAAAPEIQLPAENAHPNSEAPKSTEPQMASAPKLPSEVKPRRKPVDPAIAAANGPSQASPPSKPQSEPQIQAAAPSPSNSASPTAHASPYPPGARPNSKSVSTAHAVTATPPAPAIVAPSPPISLRLAAGTRLWITLNSVNRQADGSFTFRGSLLLPLETAGSSKLDRDTEVHGSGTVAQNRTSLLISEIVIQESHYKLKDNAGAVNAQTTGSGGVVSFDDGKVFEMWLSSDSTYKREPAPESPQQ